VDRGRWDATRNPIRRGTLADRSRRRVLRGATHSGLRPCGSRLFCCGGGFRVRVCADGRLRCDHATPYGTVVWCWVADLRLRVSVANGAAAETEVRETESRPVDGMVWVGLESRKTVGNGRPKTPLFLFLYFLSETKAIRYFWK